MPLHFASPSSSSSSPRRPPPLNIMRSLSLCRKSRPTCTLSLAHVSACKLPPPENAMQVQLDLNTIHFVAVPIPQVQPNSPRRTKTNTATTKTKITTTMNPNDTNVIPFPTSAQTSSSSTRPTSKRQQVQKTEDSDHPAIPPSVSPPRKRARKGSLATSPPSSSHTTPSPRARALAQRVPPARPSTPTPDSRSDAADDDMDVGDKSPPQPSSPDLAQRPTDDSTDDSTRQQSSQSEQNGRDLEKHGHTDLPPYSPSPPPYSPPVIAPTPTPIPLHAPIPIVPISSSSSLTSSPTIPATPTTPPPSPQSSPPPPPPRPSPSPPQRKSRISPSELRFFIFLYRTLIAGLETRQKNRLNTQQVRRARDGSRREQHLDGVLVEVDDDDVDVDIDIVDGAKAAVTEPTSPSNEDLELQDALLALRLRGFLKWNGVDERLLKVDSPSSPPLSPSNSSGVNPFLEDDGGNQMDVDIHQPPLPLIPSRHLITVLRMRGTCGPRQGGGSISLGIRNKREKSKLGTCSFEAEGDD